MSLIRSLLLASLALSAGTFLGAAASVADEPSPPAVAKSPTLAELASQLDADEFARREEASRRLTESGSAAVPELAKVAQGASLEASARAFVVLKKFAESEDGALKAAARDALSKIASQSEVATKNKNDALAAAATRAAEILKQTEPPGAGYGHLRRGVPPIQMPRPARVIIRGNNIGGQRVSIRVVDGTKQIDAEETQPDGQKKTVKIVSDPKSGIRMEVTSTKDGQSQTQKYAAKDAETLKKEQPEAYKIYEQYGGGGPAVQIGGGQIHIHNGRLEIGGGIGVAPQPMRIEMEPDFEQLLRPLIEAQAQPLIEVNEEANRAALQAIRGQLEEAHRQMRKEVDRQLREAQPAPAPAAPPEADDLFQ